jgi:hypothetical protein
MFYRQNMGYFKKIMTGVSKAARNFIYLTCVLTLPTSVFAATNHLATLLVVHLKTGATGADIQNVLDVSTNGCEVLLPPGKIIVNQPIVLQYDNQSLHGATNQTTVLYLENNANCPVIIMGQPINRPMQTIRHLCVSDLYIDGNRFHQQRELWKEQGEGSEIRNNGITIQNVSDSLVKNIICTRCRSGGLVTTLGVRRLTVENFASFNNEFDGLACYLTMDSVFSNLNLHNNPGAGISLDLAFDHNIIKDAILASNDLGIFMRDSRNNQFKDVSIRNNHNFGVFMAQSFEADDSGVRPQPETECSDNAFTNLVAFKNGRADFRVNDISCTNNVIIGAQFNGTVRALSTPEPNLVTVK